MRTGPGFWTEELRPAPPLETLTRAVAAIPWSLLLASGGKPGGRSRFMFAAFDPFLVVQGASAASQEAARLEWRGDAAAIANASGDASLFETLAAAASRVSAPGGGESTAALSDPTELLRALLATYAVPVSPAHPPFTGGLAGWFGYDLARAFERLTARAPDPLALPSFALGFFDLVIAIDRLTRKATLVATGYPEREPAARARPAEARIGWLLERLDDVQRAQPDGPRRGALAAHGVESNLAREDYIEAVRRVKNYIRAGDIFQANVTQRLRWPAPPDPANWFVDLLEQNPVGFAAFMHCEDSARRDAAPALTSTAAPSAAYHIVSLSPERFLRVSGDHIETLPIKGTRPRGLDPEADERAARDLLSSPKDRAELVMIVDLLRNDLGRVAVAGSVAVPELYALESYATVHHLVARITARLRPGLGALDALRAAFPGGSISGAPKIRAMEIIDEIEPHSRGVFMGSIGYIGANGEMDTSIAIRTAVVKDGFAHLQAGGGVVYDSRAADEYAESLHKAASVLGPLPLAIAGPPAALADARAG
jgi:para-aminobenzoate synthetase component 1